MSNDEGLAEGSLPKKPCSYCGRENVAEAIFCQECGTEIVQPVPSKPSAPRDLTSLKYGLQYSALVLAVLLFYLLSLGPVTRLWAKRTRTVVQTPTGMTVTVSMRFPPVLGKIYLPAHWLTSAPGLGQIYFQYLELWAPPETPPEPKGRDPTSN
jgi:hypothetical protein